MFTSHIGLVSGMWVRNAEMASLPGVSFWDMWQEWRAWGHGERVSGAGSGGEPKCLFERSCHSRQTGFVIRYCF